MVQKPGSACWHSAPCHGRFGGTDSMPGRQLVAGPAYLHTYYQVLKCFWPVVRPGARALQVPPPPTACLGTYLPPSVPLLRPNTQNLTHGTTRLQGLSSYQTAHSLVHLSTGCQTDLVSSQARLFLGVGILLVRLREATLHRLGNNHWS